MRDLLETALDDFCTALSDKINLPREVLDIMREEKARVCNKWRARLGGSEVYIPQPPRPRPDPAAVARDYLACDSPLDAARKHGISRATLYRLLKAR